MQLTSSAPALCSDLLILEQELLWCLTCTPPELVIADFKLVWVTNWTITGDAFASKKKIGNGNLFKSNTAIYVLNCKAWTVIFLQKILWIFCCCLSRETQQSSKYKQYQEGSALLDLHQHPDKKYNLSLTRTYLSLSSQVWRNN